MYPQYRHFLLLLYSIHYRAPVVYVMPQRFHFIIIISYFGKRLHFTVLSKAFITITPEILPLIINIYNSGTLYIYLRENNVCY